MFGFRKLKFLMHEYAKDLKKSQEENKRLVDHVDRLEHRIDCIEGKHRWVVGQPFSGILGLVYQNSAEETAADGRVPLYCKHCRKTQEQIAGKKAKKK